MVRMSRNGFFSHPHELGATGGLLFFLLVGGGL